MASPAPTPWAALARRPELRPRQRLLRACDAAPVSAPAPVITISPRRIHFAGRGEQTSLSQTTALSRSPTLKVNWINNPGVFKASLGCADLKVGQQCRLQYSLFRFSRAEQRGVEYRLRRRRDHDADGPGQFTVWRARPTGWRSRIRLVNSSGVAQAVTITNKSTEEFEVREIVVPGQDVLAETSFHSQPRL